MKYDLEKNKFVFKSLMNLYKQYKVSGNETFIREAKDNAKLLDAEFVKDHCESYRELIVKILKDEIKISKQDALKEVFWATWKTYKFSNRMSYQDYEILRADATRYLDVIEHNDKNAKTIEFLNKILRGRVENGKLIL